MPHLIINMIKNKSLFKRLFGRRWVNGSLLVGLVAVVAWVTWAYWPCNEQQIKRSLTLVRRDSYFVLYADSRPVVVFSRFDKDSTMRGLAFSEDSAHAARYEAGGFWINANSLFPSCQGKVMVATKDFSDIIPIQENTRLFLKKEIDYLKASLRNMRSKQMELRYYLRVHGVQDEGYDMVAKYATRLHAKIDTVATVLGRLEDISSHATLTMTRKDVFSASYMDKDGQWRSCPLDLLGYSRNRKYALLQSVSGETPEQAQALTILPWGAMGEDEVEVVGASVQENPSGKSYGVLMDGTLKGGRHDFSDCLMKDGHPVFTSMGTFLGMKLGNTIVYREEVKQLLKLDNDENP